MPSLSNLQYWHVPLDLADALVVLDPEGALYYLSLGKYTTLVDLVKRDFAKIKTVVTPGKVELATPAISTAIDALKKRLANPANPHLPHITAKHVFGTPAQRLVWNRLVQIPPGKTATYAEIARHMRLGNARTVGNACSANRIAVLVPCHRVRSRDTLTGYRYGLVLKQRLLQMERAGKTAETEAADC